MSTKVEVFYKRQANDLTNLLYDKGFLADNLAREAIDSLEEYIGFLFQSDNERTVKCMELTQKFKTRIAAKALEEK